MIEKLKKELIDSDPKRYHHLDVSTITDSYLVIVVGAIAFSETSQNARPSRRAVEAVKALISPQ